MGASQTESIAVPEYKRIKTTDGSTITLPSQATGTAGNEIMWIYAVNRDGSLGEAFAQAAAAGDDVFAYDGDVTIDLPTGFKTDGVTPLFSTGDFVVVIYETMTSARVFRNKSDKFAGTVRLICDIATDDACTKKTRYQKVIAPMAAISDEFSYNFGTDMAIQSFSAECMSSVCEESPDLLVWIDPVEDEA